MGKTPRVDPQHLSDPMALPNVSDRHLAEYHTYANPYHTYANPFRPFGNGCSARDLKVLWQEVYAVWVRRHR
jgi:hypothetical protein